ncbi:hypothetical protein FHETE_8 [Fusarium heterosporum]|uniref:Uncharacterized protein n=1 Tax=Fusarium heterosporum TaxID=42747 RepID=A0A8H5TZI0_FUSHE|nr:hypothetical protein FHETE_8 [Fusarium heterosporum]
MFKYAILFIFGYILLTLSRKTLQTDHNIPGLTSQRAASQMLTEGGWVGDFGVTRFPRCDFSNLVGGVVHGWPAKGGFYCRLFSAAELEFLGIDRFKPSNKSDDPEKEEAHCAKMRQLGANWYRDPDHRLRAGRKARNKDPDTPLLFVGWPAEGGVWAIKTDLSQSIRKGYGRIGNAFTMEERCKIIEELGGTFYADPKDCPHLDLDGSRDEVEQ